MKKMARFPDLAPLLQQQLHQLQSSSHLRSVRYPLTSHPRTPLLWIISCLLSVLRLQSGIACRQNPKNLFVPLFTNICREPAHPLGYYFQTLPCSHKPPTHRPAPSRSSHLLTSIPWFIRHPSVMSDAVNQTHTEAVNLKVRVLNGIKYTYDRVAFLFVFFL